MLVSNVISLGLGSPSSVEHFVTVGLEAGADVLLAGGETGYTYQPPSTTPSQLEVGPPAGVPSLTTAPASTGSTYTYSA